MKQKCFYFRKIINNVRDLCPFDSSWSQNNYSNKLYTTVVNRYNCGRRSNFGTRIAIIIYLESVPAWSWTKEASLVRNRRLPRNTFNNFEVSHSNEVSECWLLAKHKGGVLSTERFLIGWLRATNTRVHKKCAHLRRRSLQSRATTSNGGHH